MTIRSCNYLTPKNTALLSMYTLSTVGADLDHLEYNRRNDIRCSMHLCHRKSMHSITSVLPFLIRGRTDENLLF